MKYEVVKRFFSILFCLIALPFMLILTLFCVLAVMIDSPGNPFYKQNRVGKNRRVFTMYKLRTMCKDAENKGPLLAQENDERITHVGQILRKSHLDEMPQLFNILKGDMAFIGPRPERPEMVAHYLKEVPGYEGRFSVPQGLTGPAQLTLGYYASAAEKTPFDLQYVQRFSFNQDLFLIGQSIKYLFSYK